MRIRALSGSQFSPLLPVRQHEPGKDIVGREALAETPDVDGVVGPTLQADADYAPELIVTLARYHTSHGPGRRNPIVVLGNEDTGAGDQPVLGRVYLRLGRKGLLGR